MPARQITAPSVTKASQISFLQELTLNNLQESTVAEMLDCVLSCKYLMLFSLSFIPSDVAHLSSKLTNDRDD